MSSAWLGAASPCKAIFSNVLQLSHADANDRVVRLQWPCFKNSGISQIRSGKPVSPSARFEKTHLLDLYASARFSDMLVRCFITAWRNARCQSGQRTTVFGPWTSNGMSPAAWLLRCQAPKCFRAQFLCLLNRAAMAEATRRYRTQVLRLRSATTCFGRRSASTTVYGAVAY